MAPDRRAHRAAAEIARINHFFPLMSLLGNRWAASRPFEGLTIGVSAHLTTLTGALVSELALGGGRWALCATSEATTDLAVVELLRAEGVDVFSAGSMDDAWSGVLDLHPTLLADVGAGLIDTMLRSRPEQAAEVQGAVEVTRTGITRLLRRELPFGVININDGRLKHGVENRHGVGEGLWHAVQALTGMHLAGQRIGVIGYGSVGRGVAAYARAAGASVEVVEIDPVRRLFAHYDGFPTPALDDCVGRARVVVTCTGHNGVLSMELVSSTRSGLVLINAGHGSDEIDVAGIKAAARAVDQVAEHVVSYRLDGGPRVVLLGDGHPLNIVTNAGSPEPVLLHFAVLGLTLEWLTTHTPPVGLSLVPDAIEEEAAGLALQAHGLAQA